MVLYVQSSRCRDRDRDRGEVVPAQRQAGVRAVVVDRAEGAEGAEQNTPRGLGARGITDLDLPLII